MGSTKINIILVSIIVLASQSQAGEYYTYQYLFPGSDPRFIPMHIVRVNDNAHQAIAPATLNKESQVPTAQPAVIPPASSVIIGQPIRLRPLAYPVQIRQY